MTEEVPIDHVPTKVAKNNDVKDESTGNTQPDTEMLAYRKAVMEHAFVGPPSESRDEAGLESNLDTDSDPIIITGHAPATLSEGSQTSGNPNAISTRDSVEKSKAPVKFTDPIPASTAAMQTSEHNTGTASQNSSVATLSMKALFYHKNSLISGKLVVDQRNLLFEATPGSDRRKNYLTIGMRKVIIVAALSEL